MRLPDRALLVAAACCALTLAALLGSVARALHTDPRAAAEVVMHPPADSGHTRSGEDPLNEESVRLAAAEAPFAVDRQPLTERYHLPGAEPVAPDTTTLAGPPPPPAFKLIGTAVLAEGGLALLQVAEEPARVVSVGQQLQGFTLRHVGTSTAILERDEQQVRLALLQPSPQGANASARAAPRNARGNADQRGRGAQQQPPQAERARQLFEGAARYLESVGGNPANIQLRGERIEFTPMAVDTIRRNDNR